VVVGGGVPAKHREGKQVNIMTESQVLVLNVSCEPLQILAVRRAVRLVLGGKAEIVESGRGHLRSERHVLVRPAVIRLHRYVHIPYRELVCTRRGVLLRDGFTCQYCGATPPAHLLTIDHVNPRSLGGRSTWDNVVTACRPCNARKANKPLHAAHMALRSRPVQPSRAVLLRHLLDRHPAWQPYLVS
jgi:5-methylcytosine-specific restriction endonuclease McrA